MVRVAVMYLTCNPVLLSLRPFEPIWSFGLPLRNVLTSFHLHGQCHGHTVLQQRARG
jgi:hypothetical protein